MLADIKITETRFFTEVSSIDRFLDSYACKVIAFPVCEELICRGMLQPIVSKALATLLPFSARSFCFGMPLANFTSAIAVGVYFGLEHASNFEEGGTVPLMEMCVWGGIFGIMKERFGIVCPIVAHMTSNFLAETLERYDPSLCKNEIKWVKKDLEPSTRDFLSQTKSQDCKGSQ